jgi:hypothetical protein
MRGHTVWEQEPDGNTEKDGRNTFGEEQPGITSAWIEEERL